MNVADIGQPTANHIKELSEENARLKRELTEVRRLLDSVASNLSEAPEGTPPCHKSYSWALIAEVGRQVEGEECWGREHTNVLWEAAEFLDLISESMIIRDLHDRILFWNAGAEARYGWSKQDAVGQISYKLLRTEFPKPLVEIRQELFRSNRWEGELIHSTRSGNQIVSATRWALLSDVDGNRRAIVETDKDVLWKQMEKELQAKSDRLQEVNAALKTLLRQRDEDRKEFEEALLTNMENLVMPYLRRMKIGTLSNSQSSLLEIIESHLKEITSRFSKNLALEYRVLTPTEMRIAALVRDGKTSKEIADLLCISEKTASFHRNNIRTKLGLRGLGINLRSHLLSLT